MLKLLALVLEHQERYKNEEVQKLGSGVQDSEVVGDLVLEGESGDQHKQHKDIEEDWNQDLEDRNVEEEEDREADQEVFEVEKEHYVLGEGCLGYLLFQYCFQEPPFLQFLIALILLLGTLLVFLLLGVDSEGVFDYRDG